jgi:WD40 repeat protein
MGDASTITLTAPLWPLVIQAEDRNSSCPLYYYEEQCKEQNDEGGNPKAEFRLKPEVAIDFCEKVDFVRPGSDEPVQENLQRDLVRERVNEHFWKNPVSKFLKLEEWLVLPAQLKPHAEQICKYLPLDFFNNSARVPRAIAIRPDNTIVRTIAWHPYRNRLAVVRADNAIFIYDVRSARWLETCLSHEFQSGVTCIEWQPMAGCRLAVGCESGICLWQIFDDETRPGRAWMRFLSYRGHTNISSLSWCPRGDLLASASPASSSVLVWEVLTGNGRPLEACRGHGVNIVKWSHNSYYLFVGTFSSTMYVWETKTWTCESWELPESSYRSGVENQGDCSGTVASGMCQGAAWSPDGRLLAVAETGSSVVWTLALHHVPPRIDGHFEKKSKQLNVKDHPYCLPGEDIVVRELAWSYDARGERLAVTVAARSHQTRNQTGTSSETSAPSSDSTNENEDESSDSIILLYNVVQRPHFSFGPCGYLSRYGDDQAGGSSDDEVSGEGYERPYNICFWPACRSGATLASVWLDGAIKISQLVYKTTVHDEY